MKYSLAALFLALGAATPDAADPVRQAARALAASYRSWLPRLRRPAAMEALAAADDDRVDPLLAGLVSRGGWAAALAGESLAPARRVYPTATPEAWRLLVGVLLGRDTPAHRNFASDLLGAMWVAATQREKIRAGARRAAPLDPVEAVLRQAAAKATCRGCPLFRPGPAGRACAILRGDEGLLALRETTPGRRPACGLAQSVDRVARRRLAGVSVDEDRRDALRGEAWLRLTAIWTRKRDAGEVLPWLASRSWLTAAMGNVLREQLTAAGLLPACKTCRHFARKRSVKGCTLIYRIEKVDGAWEKAHWPEARRRDARATGTARTCPRYAYRPPMARAA